MEALKLAGLCVCCMGPILLLKKKTPELSLILSLAVLLVAVTRCISLATPLVERLGGLFARAGVEERELSVLLRTVAASAVTRLGSDLCRDGGSQALAAAVELAGSVAALVIALPLLEAVAELLLGYFT